MRDKVWPFGDFSLLDEPALAGVAICAFNLDLSAKSAVAGVAANLDFVPRSVLPTGVASKEARDGFFKLPGLTGLIAFFRAEPWRLLVVASVAWSRNEAVRSRSPSSSSSLLAIASFLSREEAFCSCGVDSMSSGCMRWNARALFVIEAGEAVCV